MRAFRSYWLRLLKAALLIAVIGFGLLALHAVFFQGVWAAIYFALTASLPALSLFVIWAFQDAQQARRLG